MQKRNSKNATIIILTLLAIVSIVGFVKFVKVTGYGTTALGTATVTVGAVADITLTDANITFGNGTVAQGSPFAILDSCGSPTVNGTWLAVTDFLVLENSGSVEANVTIVSTNGAGFTEGNPALQRYEYNYTDNEAGSCLLDGGVPPASATNGTVRTLSTSANVTCARLNFTDATDTIKVCLRVQIPSDAPPGLKSDQVTFTATQSE